MPASEIENTRAEEYNRFFRALGCQFSGDEPGLSLEKLVKNARDQFSAPSFRTFVCLVRHSDHFFHPGELAERAFELLWGMLVSDPNVLVAQERATGCLRLFLRLAEDPSTSVSTQALRFFEECSKRTRTATEEEKLHTNITTHR